MNGAQDLGGAMGFGPVAPQADEPLFHAPWERRALAVTLAVGATGIWTIDESRHARESLAPADYLSSSYYEIWIKGLERLLVRHGLVGERELEEGRALEPAAPVRRVLRAEEVAPALARGSPATRPAKGPARFRVGDPVHTRNLHPTGHTRLPRYARGKRGVVERVHGVHVLPDASAQGREEAQWLYTVRFAGSELWGEGSDPTLFVSIDAWDGYLDPA